MKVISFMVSLFIGGMLCAQTLGSDSNLPLPRYISINAEEANLRRGPSTDYPIDWVYRAKNLPIKVVAESGNWRKVEDHEGVQGWMFGVLLKGKRTVIINVDELHLRAKSQDSARVVAHLERNVIADLKKCDFTWCLIEVESIKGWAPKAAIWGVDDDEVFD